jgi:hypothetical protein
MLSAYVNDEGNPFMEKKLGFTRSNEHSFNVLHLWFFNVVFGIKPANWLLEDDPYEHTDYF